MEDGEEFNAMHGRVDGNFDPTRLLTNNAKSQTTPYNKTKQRMKQHDKCVRWWTAMASSPDEQKNKYKLLYKWFWVESRNEQMHAHFSSWSRSGMPGATPSEIFCIRCSCGAATTLSMMLKLLAFRSICEKAENTVWLSIQANTVPNQCGNEQMKMLLLTAALWNSRIDLWKEESRFRAFHCYEFNEDENQWNTSSHSSCSAWPLNRLVDATYYGPQTVEREALIKIDNNNFICVAFRSDLFISSLIHGASLTEPYRETGRIFVGALSYFAPLPTPPHSTVNKLLHLKMTPGRFAYYEIWFGLFVGVRLNCFLSIRCMRKEREFRDSGIVAQCDGINEGISWKRKQPKYTKRQSMKFWELKHFNWNYRARHQAIKRFKRRSRGRIWAHSQPSYTRWRRRRRQWRRWLRQRLNFQF